MDIDSSESWTASDDDYPCTLLGVFVESVYSWCYLNQICLAMEEFAVVNYTT